MSGEDLYAASSDGDVARVTHILSTEAGVDVEYRGWGGCTPLIRASMHGRLEVVQALLTHGADINAQDIWGYTALHWASAQGMRACVSALLAHPGVDLNAQNEDGRTALHLASANGKRACVSALLAHPGVQLNAQAENGDTALHDACSKGDLPVAELLLHAGADTQITNQKGKTPEEKLPEENKQAFRNLKEAKRQIEQWTSEEKKRLTEMNVLRVLYIGESNAGKTSLAQTILLNKPYLTEEKDRTVVADHFLWMPDEAPGSVFPFVDIGGHGSYKVSGHYFHCNSENNISVFCHDLNSRKYGSTFQWIESTINRSLKSETMFLLNKADSKNSCHSENIVKKKKDDFSKELEKFLEKKISAFRKAVGSAKKSPISKINVLKSILKKYEDLRNSYQEKLLVTSCLNEKQVLAFKKYLITVSKKHKLSLFKPIQLLFGKIGKRGVPIKHSHGRTNKAVQHVQSKEPKSEAKDGVHQSVDDTDWKAFGCEPDEMEYIQMQDIIELYLEIMKSLHLSTENIEEDLKDGLDRLHKNGLLMFFRGEPYLEEVIFHDINAFVTLIKCIFHHKTDDFLTVKTDDEQFDRLLTEQYSDNLTKFKKDKEQLYKQGLMTLPMLQFLLGMNDCDLDYRVVRQLLVKLEEAAFAVDDSDENSDLFIPYFIEAIEPCHSLEQNRQFERDTLVIQCDIRGNSLPITLWHYLLIKVLKKSKIQLQSRKVWKNGMIASTGKYKGKIMLLYNGEDHIEFVIKSQIKQIQGHEHIWDYIFSVRQETDRLMRDWWPGLVTENVIRCNDFVVGSEPCEGHDLETTMLIDAHDEDGQADTYDCGEVTDIPIALIQPLGKEYCGSLLTQQRNTESRLLTTEMVRNQEVELSDVYLSDLSAQIGREWKRLATYLNITRARVDQIQADHPNNTRDQITTMLIQWRNMAPGPAEVDQQFLIKFIKKSRDTLSQDERQLDEPNPQKAAQKLEEARKFINDRVEKKNADKEETSVKRKVQLPRCVDATHDVKSDERGAVGGAPLEAQVKLKETESYTNASVAQPNTVACIEDSRRQQQEFQQQMLSQGQAVAQYVASELQQVKSNLTQLSRQQQQLAFHMTNERQQLAVQVHEQNKAISQQLAYQGQVLSDQVFETGKELSRNIAMDAGDASQVNLKYSHPVLQNNKALLEERLNVTTDLLHRLISLALISGDQQKKIEAQTGEGGKQKLLLYCVDLSVLEDPGRIDCFIEALRDCGGRSNAILASTLATTLASFSAQDNS